MMRLRITRAGLVLGGVAFASALMWSEGQAAPAGASDPGKDGSPVVKITAPENNSRHPWNSLVPYSVVVTYQGKSTEYQEIPSSQVLVRTTTVSSPAATAADAHAAPTPAGLLEIVQSNCIGCHEFKAKAMGPSFAAIAARFPDSTANIAALSRYIREGSTGVFSQASMPPHAELTESQSQAMALWIEKEAANPRVNYYVGTEGAIRMEAPKTPTAAAGMIVTASYAPPGDQQSAAYGADTIILHGK
jgi:cytochrome c551/c552